MYRRRELRRAAGNTASSIALLDAYLGSGLAYAVAAFAAAPLASVLALFLLPGGRPRRLISVIQAGGLPRRLPLPRASRSRLMMASSICSRSCRNSVNILVTSIQ